MNNVKEIDIKNLTNYSFVNINIKNLNPDKSKIDENSYKNILIYQVGYVTVKDLSYTSINSLIHLYLIINKLDGCIEESNGSKYLTLVPTD